MLPFLYFVSLQKLLLGLDLQTTAHCSIGGQRVRNDVSGDWFTFFSRSSQNVRCIKVMREKK